MASAECVNVAVLYILALVLPLQGQPPVGLKTSAIEPKALALKVVVVLARILYPMYPTLTATRMAHKTFYSAPCVNFRERAPVHACVVCASRSVPQSCHCALCAAGCSGSAQ